MVVQPYHFYFGPLVVGCCNNQFLVLTLELSDKIQCLC